MSIDNTEHEWIATSDRMPCFRCFGFQTGKKLFFRLADGTEYEDIYQGWGIFGTGDGRADVTHWKPTDTTATSNDVHIHDHD